MERIKISNFRKIKGSWDFNLAPITFFTGKNNSGKSSVFKALMALSDFCYSKNHFELDFLGSHKSSHKIESYSNALNWNNNKKSNLSFEFQRYNHQFKFEFSPRVEKNDYFKNGVLEHFSVTNTVNNSKIEIERTGGTNYQMNFSNLFLEKKHNLKSNNALNVLLRTKKGIEKELEKTEKEIKEKLGIDVAAPIGIAALLPLLSVGVIGIPLAAIGAYLTKKKLNEVDDREKLTLKSKIEKLNKGLKEVEKKIKREQKKEPIVIDEILFSPSFNKDKLYITDTSISNVISKVLIPYLIDNDKKFGKMDIKDESLKLKDFCEELLDAFQFDVNHLSPNRCNQQRLILNGNSSVDISSLIQKEITKPIKKGSSADNFLKEWMIKFDIGVDYEIIPIQGQAVILNIYEKGIKQPINIADKGFGAGQLFTILLQIAQKINEQKLNLKKHFYFPITGNQHQIIIIEEPEANLHPGLQSKLTELFLETHKQFGIHFILETHSEYMIRKSQLLSLEDKIFKLYYFDIDGPYEMVYTNKGGFSRGFGEDFYDMNDELALELVLKANS